MPNELRSLEDKARRVCSRSGFRLLKSRRDIWWQTGGELVRYLVTDERGVLVDGAAEGELADLVQRYI